MKILLVDDHQLFLSGIRHILKELGPDTRLLEATTGATALERVSDHRDIDLVLLDLALPDMDGLQLLKQLHQQDPLLPVVVVSASEHPADVSRSLDQGALGFIPKSADSSTLLDALRKSLNGETCVPGNPGKLQHSQTALPQLTERQMDVLRLMAKGLPNKRIAEQLELAENTVKVHVRSLLRVLEVSNRTACVQTAERLGIIRPEHNDRLN